MIKLLHEHELYLLPQYIQSRMCADKEASLAWDFPRFQTSPCRHSKWKGLYFVPLVRKPLPNFKYLLSSKHKPCECGNKRAVSSWQCGIKKTSEKFEFHRQIDSQQCARPCTLLVYVIATRILGTLVKQ